MLYNQCKPSKKLELVQPWIECCSLCVSDTSQPKTQILWAKRYRNIHWRAIYWTQNIKYMYHQELPIYSTYHVWMTAFDLPLLLGFLPFLPWPLEGTFARTSLQLWPGLWNIGVKTSIVKRPHSVCVCVCVCCVCVCVCVCPALFNTMNVHVHVAQ